MPSKFAEMLDEEVMMGESSYVIKKVTSSASLNCKNYLNVLFYFCNTIFTYGIGTAAWFGTTTNGELSEKYQTLVTPENIAFAIWGIVFLFQGIFVFVQLSSNTRDSTLVQDGVGYWYLLTCTAQVGWSFAFGYEMIGLSVLLILVIWASLAAIVNSQYYDKQQEHHKSSSTLFEFWCLRFPFEAHCGWVTVATALNISVYASKHDVSPGNQLALAIVSLAVLHLCTFWVLFGMELPNFTISSIITWGVGWICYKLESPKAVLTGRFNAQVLMGVQNAAYVIFVICVVQLLVRLVWLIVTKLRTRNTIEYTQELSNAAAFPDDDMHLRI